MQALIHTAARILECANILQGFEVVNQAKFADMYQFRDR